MASPEARIYDPDDFLGPPIIPDYSPVGATGVNTAAWFRIPPFTMQSVRLMVEDPEVCYGLYLLKGPIQAHAKVAVECSRSDVTEFVTKQYERFFLNSVLKALKSLEWGFSPAQVLYRRNKEKTTDANHPFIDFDILDDFEPCDCTPQVYQGKIVGLNVNYNTSHGNPTTDKPTYIGMPRMFWHVNQRERSRYFGRSRLRGAWAPWIKKWSDGGSEDSLSLFFRKYAFPGYLVYVGPGGSVDTNTGSSGPTETMGTKLRRVFDQLKSGGNVFLPRTFDSTGNPSISVEPLAGVQGAPAPMLEWAERLDFAMQKGMGVVREIVESQAGALGDGGRGVPQEAFYCSLQDIVNTLVADFKYFVCDPLVKWNFGDVQYDVIPRKLIESSTASTETANPLEDNEPGNTEGGNPQDPNQPPADPNALEEKGAAGPTNQPPTAMDGV